MQYVRIFYAKTKCQSFGLKKVQTRYLLKDTDTVTAYCCVGHIWAILDHEQLTYNLLYFLLTFDHYCICSSVRNLQIT